MTKPKLFCLFLDPFGPPFYQCMLSEQVVPSWMACDRIVDCPYADDEWIACRFGGKKKMMK